jgi:hypothetical protein
MYSLGCVPLRDARRRAALHRPQRAGHSREGDVRARAAGRSRFRNSVPPHVDAAIITALGRSSADRFADAATVLAALEGDNAQAIGSGAGAKSPARRWITKGLALPIVGGIALGAVAWAALSRPKVASAEMPSVRRERFTTLAGDTSQRTSPRRCSRTSRQRSPAQNLPACSRWTRRASIRICRVGDDRPHARLGRGPHYRLPRARRRAGGHEGR